jgi:riboflavin kinase/FMN adenylyltransferase
MKSIRLSYPLSINEVKAGPVVLAMGFFDGVHRGHQKVIRTAKELANERHQPLAVLTYDKLPAIVFKMMEQPVRYLTPLKTKLSLFQKLGVDIAYVMNFTSDVAELAPQEFVDQVLTTLNPSMVVAGFDHTYGPADIANMALLPTYVNGRLDVYTVNKLSEGAADEKVSSTNIRKLVDEGQIGQANQLLGYEYITTGTIVHGFARGRTIGFPTANVQWYENERIPAVGVYAVRMKVQGRWVDGMASVGFNETFGQNKRMTIEINLFNFNHHIYGEHVTVQWVQRLRDEVKFNSVQELINQLKKDQTTSEQILADNQFSGISVK